ncbi:MAG: cupin domain-containing protein [Burkholderiales bacterium]
MSQELLAENINSDLTQRVVIDTTQAEWLVSPSPGVLRKPLDRKGRESGRATSLVCYEPGAGYSPHSHDGGEEILVLEGVFSDECGDYPAGTYLLSPPGSTHAPFSRQGCLLFVKLHQYLGVGRRQIVLDTTQLEWLPGLVPGLSVKPLYNQSGYPESVALVRWEPGTQFDAHIHPGGEEILVLDGVFEDEFGTYPSGSWLRNPARSIHRPFSRAGCTIYVKVDGLY